VVAFLRRRGIRLIIYIDDILIMAQSQVVAHQHLVLALDVLELLGFLVNYPKCTLVPTQKIEFLGFMVDLTEMTLSLPEEKMALINKEVKALLSKTTVSARQLARMVGLLTSTIPVILPARLCYRALQRKKIALAALGNYNKSAPLDQEEKEELTWWIQMIKSVNGRTIKPAIPDMVIYTDASLVGWGAVSNQIQIGGAWTEAERSLHINCLELLAAWYAIQAFTRDQRKVNILALLDGQPFSDCIHQQHGGDTINLVSKDGDQLLVVGPEEGDIHPGKAHCRQGECSSRQNVEKSPRPFRLEAESVCFQQDQSSLGSTSSGSLCYSVVNTTPKVLQLETGTHGRSSRCFSLGLDSSEGVCESSILPHIQVSEKNRPRKSPSSDDHNHVDSTNMVPSYSENVCGLSTPS
jgi:hypothetical protein